MSHENKAELVGAYKWEPDVVRVFQTDVEVRVQRSLSLQGIARIDFSVLTFCLKRLQILFRKWMGYNVCYRYELLGVTAQKLFTDQSPPTQRKLIRDKHEFE